MLNSFSLYVVRIYKVRWWNEYITKLCSKENAEFFCIAKVKKFTLHNLHTFEKKEITTVPFTPIKRDIIVIVCLRVERNRQLSRYKRIFPLLLTKDIFNNTFWKKYIYRIWIINSMGNVDRLGIYEYESVELTVLLWMVREEMRITKASLDDISNEEVCGCLFVAA